jgi:predicted branched-subunit amino acid permease
MGLVLRQHVLKKRSWSLVLLFCSLFVPLLLDFLQGQDSVVLLFVLASTFVAL